MNTRLAFVLVCVCCVVGLFTASQYLPSPERCNKERCTSGATEAKQCNKDITLLLVLLPGDPPLCWQRLVEKLPLGIVLAGDRRDEDRMLAYPCVQVFHEFATREAPATGSELELLSKLLRSNPFNSSYFMMESGCTDLAIGKGKLLAENVKSLAKIYADSVAVVSTRQLEVTEIIVDRDNVSHVDFSKRLPALVYSTLAGTRIGISRALQRLDFLTKLDDDIGRPVTLETLCIGSQDLCVVLQCPGPVCSLVHSLSIMRPSMFIAKLKPIEYYRFPAPHYYVHIPKAGSSFVNVLLAHSCTTFPVFGRFRDPSALTSRQHRRWYAKACMKEIYLCGGHCGVKSNHWEQYRGHFVGLFRDPTERLISGFLDEFHDCKSLRLDGREFLVGSLPKDEYFLWEIFQAYVECVRGCAVKQLNNIECGLDNYRNVTEAEVEYAVDKVLNYFGFVGLTSSYKESVKVWKVLFGTQLHGYDGSYNTRPTRRPGKQRALRRLIPTLTIDDPDIHVWRAAIQVFERQLEALNSSTPKRSNVQDMVLRGLIETAEDYGHVSQQAYTCEAPFWSC